MIARILHHLRVSAPRPIHVLAGDESLSQHLCVRLQSILGQTVGILHAVTEIVAPGIVVTTTSECSPDECAGLTHSGVDVIVLAALPSSFQEESYRNAGASHYLPMNLDIEPLTLALLGLTRRSGA